MKKLILSIFIAICAVTAVNAQYTNTTPITNLTDPVAFDFDPTGRVFITLKDGQILLYNNQFGLIGTFYDLSDSTYNNFERGLLGIAVDPDFANNHYVYAYYNHLGSGQPTNTQKLRVVRFTEVNNVGTNPTLILNITPGYSIAGNHVGGNIRFRPTDGKLYVTIGELAVPANAQMLTNPYGKFLRLNKDGSIPTDNPFYDDGNPATGNDDRIWSYGHRNAFDFTFSPVNDSLYSTENGQSTWDELNIVTRGKNYGWNSCEGNYTNGSSTNPCTNANFTNPIEDWGPGALPAVTGVVHYTGCLMPELTNHLLVSDNDNGRIWNIELGNAPAYDVVVNRTQLVDLTSLTTLHQGADGYIYALWGGYAPNGTGKLYKIGPQNMPGQPNAVITSNPGLEYCLGDYIPVTALADGGNLTYEFTLTGDNSESIVSGTDAAVNILTNGTGSMDLKLITSNGCTSDSVIIADYATVYAAPTYTLGVIPWEDPGPGHAYLTNYTNVDSITWYNDAMQVIFSGTDSVDLAVGVYYLQIMNGPCTVIDTFEIAYADFINENAFSAINVYPNPTNNRLFIDLKGKENIDFTAQIFNAVGSIVQSTSVNGKALAELNVEALPAGIYYLTLRSNKGLYYAKFSKD